jgi:putative flippase GtrA
MFSNAIGGSVNVGLYAWMVHQSAIARENPTLGVAFGSVAGMLVNFTLMKIFVFRSRRQSARRAG